MHCLGVRDAEQKTPKDLYKGVSRFWGCDEKFCLVIRKGVYQYKYMDGWKKFEDKFTTKKCDLQ